MTAPNPIVVRYDRVTGKCGSECEEVFIFVQGCCNQTEILCAPPMSSRSTDTAQLQIRKYDSEKEEGKEEEGEEEGEEERKVQRL